MRYQFIEAHRAEFEVQVMCDVLDVSRSGYYAWRTRPASAREMPDADFVRTIRRIFEDSGQTYGYESIWRAMQTEEQGCSKLRVRRFRRQYDEFLAYTDVQFGRLLDYLESSGRLEDTIVVFTSDHGQMFERGIHGHVTPVLYDPVVRIPLLVSLPGQRERDEVTSTTSCVDLLPTLLYATDQRVPEWCEGKILPLAGVATDNNSDRSIFAIEAKRNPKLARLEKRTVAKNKGEYKLIHYAGYDQADDAYELYNVEHDPEEREDLAVYQRATAKELGAELMERLKEADERRGI